MGVDQLVSGGDVNDPVYDSVTTETLDYALNNTGYSGRLSDRPLVSQQDRTITVGTDTSTIQEALNQIPLILRHKLYIDVPDGTYNEDLLIPPVIGADTMGDDQFGSGGTDEGSNFQPWIQGNPSTPTNCTVDSITIVGAQGAMSPMVEGFNPVADTPHADETTAVIAFGCQNVEFEALDFTGCATDWGITFYSSAGTVRGGTHFGNGDLDVGVALKHEAHCKFDGFNGVVTGTLNNYVIRNTDGSIVVWDGGLDATGGSGIVDNREGLAFNHDASLDELWPSAGAEARGSGSDQSVPQNTWTTLEFDTTQYDRGEDWGRGADYDTSTYEYTVPFNGRYHIEAQVQWVSADDASRYELAIRDGSGGSRAHSKADGSGASNPTQYVGRTPRLTKGTVLKAKVLTNAGSGARTVNMDANTFTFFSVNRLS